MPTPTSQPETRATVIRDVTALAALWCGLALIVDPRGAFPLNDDWAYGLVVRTLAETGRLQFNDWGAMTLLAHVGWGAGLAFVFGFSFELLRLGTLVLGGLGLMACYGTFRACGFSRRDRWLATAVVGFNPIYFLYAFTFMTDVPFFAVSLGLIYCWIRGHQTRRLAWLLAAALLLVTATLIRQVAIGWGLGLAAATLCGIPARTPGEAPRSSIGRRLVLAAAWFALPVVTLAVFNTWAGDALGLTYKITGWHLTEPLLRHPGPVLAFMLPYVAWRLFGSFFYLGLFCLPLALTTTRFRVRSPSSWLALGLAAAALVTAGATGRAFPWFGDVFAFPANTFSSATLGPPTLSDVLLVHKAHLTPIPRVVQWLLTAAGAVGGFGLAQLGLQEAGRCVRSLLRRRRPERSPEATPGSNPVPGRARPAWLAALVLVGGAFYFAPFLLAQIFFDRYVLLLVPLALLGLGTGVARPAGASRLRAGAGWLVVTVMALYVVGSTHDYLAWNRARWAAADQLLHERGVALREVDGGFEFNMWHRYDRDIPPTPSPVWWWQGTGRFRITFGPLEGYGVKRTVPVDRWLPFGVDRLFVLEKT